MVGFPLYNQALAFCCLALACWQSPCLAQSITETTNQRDAPSNLKPAPGSTKGPDSMSNSLVPGSTAVDQFAFVASFWTDGPTLTEESSTDSAASKSDGTATAGTPSQGNSDPQNPQTSGGGQTGAATNYVLRGNFFRRLGQFYKQDWNGTNPSGPVVAKRGFRRL
jgi:hypothetical protein